MPQRNAYISELRQYDNPASPETSPYDVILPPTTTDAVIEPESRKSVTELLLSKPNRTELEDIRAALDGISNTSLTLTGDITGEGSICEEITATIADDSVTADKILNCAALGLAVALGTDANVASNAIAIGINAYANGGIAIGAGSASGSSSAMAFGISAEASASSSAAIGNAATSAHTHAMVLGRAATSTVTYQILLGASNHKPYAYAALTVLSDARDKTDIDNLQYDPIEFISRLKPRQYRMDVRSDYTRREEITEAQYNALDDYTRQHKAREIPVYSLGDIRFVELDEAEKPDRYKTVLTSDVYRSREEALTAHGKEDAEKQIEQVGTIKLLTVQLERNGDFTGKRYHNGFISQEVKELADDMGFDFAGFNDHAVNGGEDLYSLTYEEFIAPMVGAMQQLIKKNEELEARLNALEAAAK